MLRDIKPFYIQTNTCLENLYVSICNAFKRNFVDMYTHSWAFGYKKCSNSQHSKLFGKRITSNRDRQELSSDQICALEKYCGISPIWHINCEYKNFIEIVKKELENNRPVALGTDIFYCYWHKASSKYHFMHYGLIVGINENGFICIDDTLASTDGNLILSSPPESVILDFNTLKEFNAGFITFQIGPYMYEQSTDEMIYLSALKTLTGFDGKSDFQNMRELLVDIDKYLDIDREIYGFADPWAIDLIRRFGFLVWSRVNYITFLREKQKYKGVDIQAISDKMDESMNLWGGIRYYVMKYSIDPDAKFNKDIVCDSLSDIIKIEENLANEIVNGY
jgi:hypothetical protein